MPMGFSQHPGPLPFVTVRDRDKWAGRLAAGHIEIHGEHGVDMPMQMVRVRSIESITHEEAAARALHVPGVYRGKHLIAVHLEALDA